MHIKRVRERKMRFYLFGSPRLFGKRLPFGIRPGMSFSPSDFTSGTSTQRAVGGQIKGSFVYVVRGDHNMSKIGVTTNPRARLAQLKTGSAFPIGFAYLAATPGNGIDIEKEAHRMIGEHKCHGEWFDVSPEIATLAVVGAATKLSQP